MRVAFYLALALLCVAPAYAETVWPTKGGDGGRVITVTTLADAGPGSLREALEASGPRRITFAVSGEIWLRSTILVREPFVTVAGETAPAPGISLMGDRAIRVRTHDVILRHLRVRVGALPNRMDPQNRDALAIDGGPDGSDPAYNVLVENCSLAWSIDELLQVWGRNTHDVRVRNSIFAEALANSIHPKGMHSMALIVGPDTRNVVIEGNLFAHNALRNPAAGGGAHVVIVNNLIYNPGSAAIHFYGDTGGKATFASVVGNIVIAGADTRRHLNAFSRFGINEGSKIFYADNKAIGTRAFDPSERTGPVGFGTSPIVNERPVWVEGIPVLPSEAVFDHVLAAAGARPDARDETDTRIIEDVKKRTGRLRDWPPDARLLPNAEGEKP